MLQNIFNHKGTNKMNNNDGPSLSTTMRLLLRRTLQLQYKIEPRASGNPSYTNRKFVFYVLVLVFASGIFSSCNKILNVSSPNAVPDGSVFTSASGLQNARIGMYSSLQNKNYYGGVFPLLAECYSDNGTTGGYDVIDLNDIAAKAVQPSNIYTTGIYQAIYNSIYTANEIIANIDNVPNLDATIKSNTLGEAYFVRGLCEFDLLRLFGEHWDKTSKYGISIVLTPNNPKIAVARSTVSDSYKQIIADLQQAISSLNTYNGNQYASVSAAKALLARVDLYYGDYTNAASLATDVINDNNFALLGPNNFTSIYATKLTSESVFELKFDLQNQSSYNTLTYVRSDALRTDVAFLAAAGLNTFFQSRPTDLRSTLVDYTNVDVSIQPDGRTQKYRGEQTKDNSGYILRLAEVFLIRAEALGKTNGLADLNTLRENRGMADLSSADVPDSISYLNAVLDERRAELNFEGHRLFDLARTNNVSAILGTTVNPIMPIPQREIDGTNNVVIQNQGY